MITHPHLTHLAGLLLPIHHDVLDTLAAPKPQTVEQVMEDTGLKEGPSLVAIRVLRRHGLTRCTALQLTPGRTDECLALTERGGQLLATLAELGRHPGV